MNKKQKVVKLSELTEEEAILLMGEALYNIAKKTPDIEVTLTLEWKESKE